jgi:hypothetical protein
MSVGAWLNSCYAPLRNNLLGRVKPGSTRGAVTEAEMEAAARFGLGCARGDGDSLARPTFDHGGLCIAAQSRFRRDELGGERSYAAPLKNNLLGFALHRIHLGGGMTE